MRINGKKSKGTKKKELSDTEKASQDDVKQPSSSINKEQDAMCYLCHETGADESRQPLRRDCACRGTERDLSTSPALLDMQKQKVCDGMFRI
jgi:hypothetical protein